MNHFMLKILIKRNVSRQGNKTYVSHLFVASVMTPAGPRHRTICNLGKIDPGPRRNGWNGRTDPSGLGRSARAFPDVRVEQAVRWVRKR